MRPDCPKEILAVTLEFKELKKALYESALKKCSERAGIEVFALLRDQELEHIDRLEKNTETAEGTNPFPPLSSWNWEKAEAIRGIIFGSESAVKPGAEDMMALQKALSVEQACLQFFNDCFTKATDPRELEFLSRMISEEEEHMALLSDLGLLFAVHGKRSAQTRH